MPRENHKSNKHKKSHEKHHSHSKPHHEKQGHQHGGHTSGGSGGGDPMGGLMGDMMGAAARSAGSAVARRAVAYALSGGQGAAAGAKAGNFDMYLFAQSWAPRFCCSQKDKCESQGIQGISGATTHGLWPSYAEPKADGKTFPAFCQKKPKDEGSGFNLAEHEWQKHGTCTSLSREKYFEEEHKVAEKLATPQMLLQAEGASVDMEELRDSYTHEVGLQLDDKCRLREITSCFAKNRDGSVGVQVDCPEHVMDGTRNLIGSCKQVFLEKPGSCAVISKKMLQMMKAA